LIKKEFLFSPKGSIITVFFLLILFLVIFIPKIYLRNNIYYLSKDVNKLYSHYLSLKEEEKHLKQQLENEKFKNQITNSLILQDLEENK